MKIKIALAAALLSAASVSVSAQAQGLSDLPGDRGAVKVTANSSGIDAKSLAALQAKAVKVYGLITSTPALADPRGFAVRQYASAQRILSKAPRNSPYGSDGSIIVLQVDAAKKGGDGRYAGQGEGPAIYVRFNMTKYLLDAEMEPGDFKVDQSVKTRNGVTLMKGEGADVMFISKPDRPFLIPITQGEAADQKLAKARAYLAEDATNTYAQKDLAKVEAEVAAILAADRAAPACYNASLTRIRPGKSFGCEDARAPALMRLNPSYYDPAKGKGSVQLISIALKPGGRGGPDPLRDIQRAAASQIDIPALQRLLD